MTLDQQLTQARNLMDRLHARARKQVSDLDQLCDLLCSITAEHAEAGGADGEVVAAIIAPKEEP